MRPPLDASFNAHNEMEELNETRAEVKDNKFAESIQSIQEIQEAIQRAQIVKQRGCLVSIEEFDALKGALNLQLGKATPTVHATIEKESKFLYA